MFASIHRYRLGTTRIDDAFELRGRLAAELARSPGFVAAVVVEDSAGTLLAIRLFEDQASLTAATPFAEQWIAEQRGTLEPGATELATGEVVAQKGL